jgi:N-6 DNA Methylase
MRGPLERLLQSVATALGLCLVPRGEASLSDLRVRPDYAIEIDRAICGHLEVKAPGKGANPAVWKPTSHDARQWEKLKLLPNVLYTDGNEWALYRDGVRVGNLVRLRGDVRTSGSRLAPPDSELARVLAAFLRWSPTPPRTLNQLVRSVAGLCRLLREEVAEALIRERTSEEAIPFTHLAADWRELLFPEATDAEFADGYAQTVTFALLLARVEQVEFAGRSVGEVARLLGREHSLMGRALDVLTDPSVNQLAVSVDTLVRVIGVVDWDKLQSPHRDPYLYLYELFLEVYDPELRRQTGSYYTPAEVVAAMVRMTDELLRRRLGQPLGYASDQVVVVDPAMGTGTYLLDILERAADAVVEEEGAGSVGPRLRRMLRRVIGFEKQTGPYAVAQLRMHAGFRRHRTEVPPDGLRLFLADTLDNPYGEEAHIFASLEPIARSRQAANKIKRDEPVMVVIGNPPYHERAKDLGGWIEQGNPQAGQQPPLDAFRAPTTAATRRPC